jgi:hypothetical protein
MALPPSAPELIARVCALWMFAALALGCEPDVGDELPEPVLDAGRPWMELGQGELEFAPLAQGEALPYEHGPQGGQHVWVAFRAYGLDPLRVLVTVTTAVEGRDDLVLERRGRVNFEIDESGAAHDAGAGRTLHVYEGWPAQILKAVEHPGERAHIDVTLEDRAGRTAHAEATIVIAEPE